MGLIREPLDVDFTVEPHEFTNAEKTAISEYIREYKLKETKMVQISTTNDKVVPKKKTSVNP